MKKLTLLALLVVFALPGISLARDHGFGWEGPGHGKKDMGVPRGKWWKMPEVANKLALTEEEKEKLDTMYLGHRQQMIDLHGQVEKERLELEQLLDSSTFNATACMDRFKKVQEAQSNLATERFRFLVQAREMLGLDRFQQLKAEVRQHRMKGKPGRHGPERGPMSVE